MYKKQLYIKKKKSKHPIFCIHKINIFLSKYLKKYNLSIKMNTLGSKMYKYTNCKLPLFKTMSKLLLYHMLFGSNILGGKSIFSYLFKNMAHKKTILNKFQVESDSSDCRSPRHDGQKWYVPETSFSEDIKNTNTSEEDPDVYVNPSTSSQGNSKQITSQNECKISSRIPIQPPKKRHINPETNSSGSRKYFNTDDSPHIRIRI